uniref:Uncharacterized protein n=1 Tax=Arundo donax TaxID=35708 RepID=A0A0A9G4Y1_ARUDO
MLINVRDIDGPPHTILPITLPGSAAHPPPSQVEAIPSPAIHRMAATVAGSVAAGVLAPAAAAAAAPHLQVSSAGA